MRPGERVTLFSENRWEWVAAYHGILRAGCVVNPVNAILTAPELAVIVDRLKDMILSGGYNVYPAEIERVLAAHPDVALVGVGRVPDPTLGEVAHAYIVPAQGHAPDPDAILAFARTQLAPYKIPKAVHVVAALPLQAVSAKGPR